MLVDTSLSGLMVLVIGASIGGPTVAHQLARRGAVVTVVEKAPELRSGGQLVDVRGVGREVLRRMGIDDAVRAATEGNDSLSFVDGRYRRSGRLRARDFGGDGPIAEIEILRGALSRVVVEASQALSVEYRFGDHVAHLVDDGGGVDVTFGSGISERYDVVIAADGLHSEMRRRLFGANASPVHLDTYVAFWTAENHLDLIDETVLYSEPGRSVGMRTILDNSKVMAFLTFRGGPPSYEYRDVEAQKRITLLRGSGMGWETAQLLSQIDTATDFYFDTCAQVRLESWSQGRIALLGDAAYCASPLSGHGATIAMVGAYVLAAELARAGGDHTTAFSNYRRIASPWIARVQASARRQGRLMTPETEFGIRFRATITRVAERLPAKQWLVRDSMTLSNSFALPEGSLDLRDAGRIEAPGLIHADPVVEIP